MVCLYQARVLAECDFHGMLHWDEAGRCFFVELQKLLRPLISIVADVLRPLCGIEITHSHIALQRSPRPWIESMQSCSLRIWCL